MPFHENFLPIPTENPLQTFFLPLLLIFTILYGALTLLHLFSKRINFILALVFTLFTMATPVFTWFSTVLPTYGAVASVGAFAAIFVIGVLSWAFSKGKESYYQAKYASGPRYDRIEKLNKILKKLNEEYMKAERQGNYNKMKDLLAQKEEIEREMQVEVRMKH